MPNLRVRVFDFYYRKDLRPNRPQALPLPPDSCPTVVLRVKRILLEASAVKSYTGAKPKRRPSCLLGGLPQGGKRLKSP